MSTVETKVGRFVWHDHMSGDPDAARRFYTELFGWDYEMYDAGNWQYPMIKANGTTHGGFGSSQGGAPPHWLGHISVDDVDAPPVASRLPGARSSPRRWTFRTSDGWSSSPTRRARSSPSTPLSATRLTPSEGVFVWDELLTTDVEAAKRFYSEVVGWETRDMEMGPNGVYTLFSLGGADRAGCMPRPERPRACRRTGWRTSARATSTARPRRPRSLGATVLMEPFDILTVGRLSIIADPTGAVVGLFQPAAESVTFS